MSVYRRAGAQTFSYDFQYRGVRFLGRTEETTRRGALAVERIARDEAKQTVSTKEAIDAPKTWELASSRWYAEIGQHHKNCHTDAAALDWLTRAIGKQTPLVDIDDNRVAALVAKRRAEVRQVGKIKNRKKRVGPATVNRTVTEPLRKVMLRAKNVWKVPVGDVIWSQHMLAEPKERVREANQGEENAILSRLDRGYEDAMRFAFLSGCRRMEIVGLVWPRVDFFGRQFTVIGKGGKSRTIPMSTKIFDLLWRQRDNHDEAVFTFIAQKTRREHDQVRGWRYPITEAGLRTAARRATTAAGVENFRFHDTRHTAATRTLRASNLRVVQELLGHEDVSTTTKYAHALAEDIRAALEAASATTSPDKSPAGSTAAVDKSMDENKKAG